jgi:hypothetical protein
LEFIETEKRADSRLPDLPYTAKRVSLAAAKNKETEKEE